MCGIVGYFGNTGNSLTHVFTGMSHIFYRAPDSTGVGWLGDSSEPIKVRKTVGSIKNLIEVMLYREVESNETSLLLKICTDEYRLLSRSELQRYLLEWEGFSADICKLTPNKITHYPLYYEIIDVNRTHTTTVKPGCVGRATPLPTYYIDSIETLGKVIKELILQYDIPPLVTHTLLRKALSLEIEKKKQAGSTPVMEEIKAEAVSVFDSTSGDLQEADWTGTRDAIGEDFVGTNLHDGIKHSDNVEWSDILVTLDDVFEHELWEEIPEGNNHQGIKNPHAYKLLWELLSGIPLKLPPFYDPDGVMALFRLFDAALLTVLIREGTEDELNKKLVQLWPEVKKKGVINWRALYQAEKEANVYGWAAAAAFEYLKERECRIFSVKKDEQIDGATDPNTLRFLTSPVISQGRWAMQSAVTEENAHPFFDQRKERIIVLNGQFNGEIEAELHDFLKVSGFTLRSANSAEYMALLWGYYFDVLSSEQLRYQQVRYQIDAGLENYCIGSRNIDYKIYNWLKQIPNTDFDQLAFIEATKQLIKRGGQVAVAGISLRSPRRMYVASHNRPVFLVRRTDRDDVMVVSDINAAMGLFSQSLIMEKAEEIKKAKKEYQKELALLEKNGADKNALRMCRDKYIRLEKEILKAFQVEVIPLEGEEVFARIETEFDNGGRVNRKIEITDFSGNYLHDIEEFQSILNPFQTKKDVFRSFYETHLNELPDRLFDIWNMHLPEGEKLPQLGIRQRTLRRRFGPNFEALKRIILLGMGSSYNMALVARKYFQELLPNIDIVVFRPVEIEHVSRVVDPERDLLVLLSWSGTTAEMVDIAKDLYAYKCVMVGITDKPFSDMALITRRSGGVITIFSGEEITVSAVKSSICLLFCACMMAVKLAALTGREEEALSYLEELGEIPQTLSRLRSDSQLHEFLRKLASMSAHSHAAIVIDDLCTSGTAIEAAYKLEENGQKAVGKALDYRDLVPDILKSGLSENLIMLNATLNSRRKEAVNAAKRLYLAGVDFALVSSNGGGNENLEAYTGGLHFVLPKLPDSCQPFVDLFFYYTLAYYYGLAQKLGIPGFPRNRAKSVTSSRSRVKKLLSPMAELVQLRSSGQIFQKLPEPDYEIQSLWEKEAEDEQERRRYEEIRRLARIVAGENPLEKLLRVEESVFSNLTHFFFDNLSEGGEVVLICLDRYAKAAGENIVSQWEKLTEGLWRVSTDWQRLNRFSEETILFFLSSVPPEPQFFDQITGSLERPAFWLGSELPEEAARVFKGSLGYCVTTEEFSSVRVNLLYAITSLILSATWEEKNPGKADPVKLIFQSAPKVLEPVLNSVKLKKEIKGAMEDNRMYKTAFFVGPPGGTEEDFTFKFEEAGSLLVQSYYFGESAHGPIATVDPEVDKKFVRIRSRQEMADMFGEEKVKEWEKAFLGGKSVDFFLQNPARKKTFVPGKPFYAEGYWYLPVLNPHYDITRDNLIIIDATNSRYFEQALDDLATYGCRYARIIAITQEVFASDPEKRGLYAHHIDHTLHIPSIRLENKMYPLPDILLPFVLELVATAASVSIPGTKLKPSKPEKVDDELIRKTFSRLGDIMADCRIALSQLNYRLITGLKKIAPLVENVEGVSRYRIKEIGEEQTMIRLIEENKLYAGEEVIKRFRFQIEQHDMADVPFLLFNPDSSSFQGKAAEEVKNYPPEYWHNWYEVFGDAWKSVVNCSVDTRESLGGEPIVELPLKGLQRDEGWIYHFYVSFREWDHAAPLDHQLSSTVSALHEEHISTSRGSTRYLIIANTFNEEMMQRGIQWEDWLLSLISRTLLLRKPAEEIYTQLKARIESLLEIRINGQTPRSLEEIGEALREVWGNLTEITPVDDRNRWESIYREIKSYLLKKSKNL